MSALDELRLVANAGVLRELARKRHHVRVVFDAERLRAELRGGDHIASVTRSEIDYEVLRRDLAELHQLVDHVGRRWHPHDVLARLA
jgi:hypothetical protein